MGDGTGAVVLARTLPVQAPLVHFWPDAQALPQAPQLFLSLLSFRQRPLQLAWPALQVIRGVHLPAAQFSPIWQVFPQLPQLLRSLARSAQVVPHWLSGAGQVAVLGVVWAQARRGDTANGSNADSTQRRPEITFIDMRARLDF